MAEKSPLDSPEGDWWNRSVNRRETMWLGLSGAWALALFGWMLGWTRAGGQNQMGPTYRVSPKAYQQKVADYKDRAGALTVDGQEMLVPPDEDVYVGAFQWAWDGLPVVLQPGTTYKVHLGSYDVQHGLSIRRENNLSQQVSLQVLPGYEWVLEMSFDDPGTYQVVCNEFCGVGHRTMHGRFLVRSHEPVETGADSGTGSEAGGDETGNADYGGWFTDEAKGGSTDNYGGSAVDQTGTDRVSVVVGADGNGGPFAFDPPAVTVSSGTTVAFEWASDGHNLLVEDQPDGAGWEGHETLENSGFDVEHTFEKAGVYEYYCEPHLPLGMKGVVEVA